MCKEEGEGTQTELPVTLAVGVRDLARIGVMGASISNDTLEPPCSLSPNSLPILGMSTEGVRLLAGETDLSSSTIE